MDGFYCGRGFDDRRARRRRRGRGQSKCNLGNGIKHVVYIQFDNVHFRRDNPNVPSDLEQMPNLLNFLEGNGTFLHQSLDAADLAHLGRHRDGLTGVYGDKFGVPIGNSFGLFGPNGVAHLSELFHLLDRSFWPTGCRRCSTSAARTPRRHGCRSLAPAAMSAPFRSPTSSSRTRPPISTTCSARILRSTRRISTTTTRPSPISRASASIAPKGALSARRTPRPTSCKDEPGGYTGFTALFGNANVQPQISPGGPVTDLDGNVIADSHGNPGFPGLQSHGLADIGLCRDDARGWGAGRLRLYRRRARQSRTRAVRRQHRNRANLRAGRGGLCQAAPGLSTRHSASSSPGSRQRRDSRRQNTLFVITADENDHFVGGPPSPANCDGVTIALHLCQERRDRYRSEPADGDGVRRRTPFASALRRRADFLHQWQSRPDSSPLTRRFEHEAGRSTAFNPDHRAKRDHIDTGYRRSAGASLPAHGHRRPEPNPQLHHVRQPRLLPVGDRQYAALRADLPSCSHEETGFAWNHGDFQTRDHQDLARDGGPGVRESGCDRRHLLAITPISGRR